MPDLAVVFVSYLKVPEQRLQDHFRWNRANYEVLGDRLRVYVVSDVEHDLPDYAETYVIPLSHMPRLNGQPVFSLSMTKNLGIAKACFGGARVIVSTDVDISFDHNDVGRFLHDTSDADARIPLYQMAESYETRNFGRIDHGCTGTIAMTATNWLRLKYDERCVGYGSEDGILVRDIQAAGIKIRRYGQVAHIAHVTGDGDRTPGSGAETCWGRDSGFNPDNFRANRQFHNVRTRHIKS